MAINEEKLKESLNHQPQQKSLVKEDKGIAAKNHRDVYEEVISIGKENNRLLRKIVRHQQWATFATWLKVLIIIVPLIAAYFYLPPLIKQVMNNYSSAMGTMNTLKSTTQEIENAGILQQFKDIGEMFK